MDISKLEEIIRDDEESWKKIASTLENDSKLYGFRVDSMSDVINKMQGRLIRSEVA